MDLSLQSKDGNRRQRICEEANMECIYGEMKKCTAKKTACFLIGIAIEKACDRGKAYVSYPTTYVCKTKCNC